MGSTAFRWTSKMQMHNMCHLCCQVSLVYLEYEVLSLDRICLRNVELLQVKAREWMKRCLSFQHGERARLVTWLSTCRLCAAWEEATKIVEAENVAEVLVKVKVWTLQEHHLSCPLTRWHSLERRCCFYTLLQEPNWVIRHQQKTPQILKMT